MAYTFLDNSLNTIGVLTNKGGQTNDYWGDSITHEIATSQDVLTSVSLSVDKPTINIDTSGNQKTWNHIIQGLSFNIDGIGRQVNENDYLIYQEGTNGKYYLMAITQVDESAVQSGFHYKTVQGLNAAAYDLSRKTLRAKSFAQIPDGTQEKGTAQNILKYIFDGINWDVRTIGSFGAIDYEITEGTTAQAVLLDIIGMFEAEVDAYVQLNNWGKGSNVFNKNGSIKRIFDFSTSIGKYRGETIRYDKNMVSITKTGARDSMYTKLYVNGNNISIADVNHGADFIVDDVANRKYNKLGSVSNPVTYLEGIITNSAIESPTALLAWGKKQLNILNHPRYNYQISATNDDKVQLGDTVIIQDTHASDPIYLKSKVISKTVSLADPVNNSFVVGEFSPIVIGADNNLEDTNQIMQLVNQANQTAVNAQKQADENAQKIEDTRTDLEKNIDDRISEANSYSDELTQKAVNQINDELATVKSESDNLSAKTDQMIADANSYADTMYNNAVSFAKTEASKALSDANTALDEAKSDLTNGIASEASERQQAVQTANSQAQSYANQAKSDAIAAATTADGVVRKDFKVTTDALSSTISQNKQDSDGRISTAQTTATQALNGLETKVSQTDYDNKTGDLSTKVNTVTQTATETKNELANVSKTVDSQSAQINTISNTVDGTTQTISDIQTEQGKQSGSIATLQSRANGFDATVTKVNNLSVGGRNLLIGTNSNDKSSLNAGNGSYTKQYVDFSNGYKYNFSYTTASTNWAVYMFWGLQKDKFAPNTDYVLSFMANVSTDIKPGVYFANGAAQHNFVKQVTTPTILSSNGDQKVVVKLRTNSSIPDESDQALYINGFVNKIGTFSIWDLKIEKGNLPTDWTPAPEDLSSATAKAQLTADNATLAINNYKTDADGRIKKAQADIEVNANAITQKVSQSDYDKKTGDLTTSVNTAQSTADSATQTIGTYKETNDKRVASAETKIKANSDAIKLTVSKTDFDEETGKLSGDVTTLQQRANGFDATVTKVDNLAVDGRNLIIRTGELVGQMVGPGGQISSYGSATLTPAIIKVTPGEPLTMSGTAGGDNTFRYAFYDEAGNALMREYTDLTPAKTVIAPAESATFRISYPKEAQVKLERGNVATDWSPAPEDAYDKISTVSQTVEGISSIVSDPTTGLAKRIQTAEGTLSQVTGADIPKLQKATFWQPYSSLNFNDYTKQGSFFFNTTSAKTNGPTTSNSWIYLIVEQGTADNSRIKQTAWYDGVNGVKITYVRTLNSGTWSPWYANDNDSVATISQTNDSIKREIEDRKTGDNNTLQSSKNFTTSSITNYDQGIQSQFTQTANGILAQVESTNMVVNSEFDPLNGTWYALSNGGATGSQLAEAWSAPKATGFADWSAVNGSRVISYAVGTWYSSALVIAGGGNTFSASIVAGRAPAPKVSTALDFRIGFWDSSRKLLTTASAGNIIDGTVYKGAQKYVVENKTAPANTAFVSVIIAHSSANATDFITRPSLNTGAKASPYTPTYGTSSSSTVLSLFKDNWSIGINDNIGKITSGIVGDAHSMSLISNNIILDGNTTVTGDFYAKGGNFKNLNASNITTGTINAANIKVINLDVSSLSGNIANFVTGNISNLDASVLHGNTGYLDTVSTGRIINNQDHHLQLAAHGMYNNSTHRAQFELLAYDDPAIDDGMKGSLNYYSETGDNTHGIRFKANHILAIDTYPNGAGNLYLSAYNRGEVRIVNRDGDQYAPIAASRFRVASQRALKSNITDLKDGALDIVNSIKIHKYTKSGESEIGVITDEVPDILKSDDNRTISLYDYTSVLYKAVQELSKQVKELQDERTNS